MVRSKPNLEYRKIDSASQSTFNKKTEGLMKKAHELSTLCGVEMCVIVFGPYTLEPEVWPSPLGVHQALTRFRSTPEYKQRVHMINQEAYLAERIKKLEEILVEKRLENRRKDGELFMYAWLRGEKTSPRSSGDLYSVGGIILEKINKIDGLIERRKMESVTPETEAMFGARTGNPPESLKVMNEMMGENFPDEVEMISGVWGETFPTGVELLTRTKEE